jgi:multiple sugar transport system substrate-binding protein
MVELEFSVLVQDNKIADQLVPLLHDFEEQFQIRVNLVPIPWERGWTEIAKMGIFSQGPDVSEVGTTWVGSLASMQALRAFSGAEVSSLGEPEAFFETVWQTGILSGDDARWAIPWLGDTLVFYYWKDMLEKAGIGDPQAAFSSHPELVKTMGKLQEHGFPYPLELTTSKTSRNLHDASCWIWNAGGELMSQDGRRVTFTDEPALKGLKNYFGLRSFVSPDTLTKIPGIDWLAEKKAAVVLSGPWHGIAGRASIPEWSDRIGVASVLGTPYVGGTSLVIWKHSRHEREACELIRFLSSRSIRIPGSPHTIMLPARRESLNLPTVASDSFQKTCLAAMQTGHSFPTVRVWGSIEEKLIWVINIIWADLFAHPSEDPDESLHRHLVPLAARLNLLNS